TAIALAFVCYLIFGLIYGFDAIWGHTPLMAKAEKCLQRGDFDVALNFGGVPLALHDSWRCCTIRGRGRARPLARRRRDEPGTARGRPCHIPVSRHSVA